MIFSLRAKILVIVLVFLALIGATFIFYSMTTTFNYKQLRLESMDNFVDREAEKVNKIILEIERGAVFYAISGKLVYDAGLEKLGDTFALEYVKSYSEAAGGGFWYEPFAFKDDKKRSGFYAFYDKKTDNVIIDDTFMMETYNYHDKPWYKELIENITEPYQVAWTKPYVDDSGTFSLMTTAGSGVFGEDGELIAISTVDWKIEDVISELIQINPTKNSFVLLCVPEEDYIISSSRRGILAGDSVSSLPWDIKNSSFLLNRIKYICFSQYMDNGWFLTIQIPENEIFAEVEKRNAWYSLAIGVFSLLMLLFAYILISRFINTPLKKLKDDVANIAFGNLDTQIKIKTRDELSLLANSFNKMTLDLKHSIEENLKDREEKKRISTELSVAKDIQLSMLPNVFPAFPDRDEFDLFASMVPARDVGGDFYDFYLIDKDNLAVVIADVSGKGVPAALFMVISKTLIKYSSSSLLPQVVFNSVNKRLCDGNDKCMFVTAFLGILNIPTGKFTYVNAGHNPPLLRRKDGYFEYFKKAHNTVLAFMEDIEYKHDEIILNKGDMLYLYTDGVTEAMNCRKELFNEDRLLRVLQSCSSSSSPKKIIQAVKNEVENFTCGEEQTDDITMLALTIGKDFNDDEEEKIKFENEINLEASIENYKKLMEFINNELEKHQHSLKLINEIQIAAEEIFVNIIKFAYDNRKETVKIQISGKNSVIIRFIDTGRHFNPLERQYPDLEKDIIDREPGGLGILMVQKLTDTLTYAREDGKNILTLTKNRL